MVTRARAWAAGAATARTVRPRAAARRGRILVGMLPQSAGARIGWSRAHYGVAVPASVLAGASVLAEASVLVAPSAAPSVGPAGGGTPASGEAQVAGSSCGPRPKQ